MNRSLSLCLAGCWLMADLGLSATCTWTGAWDIVPSTSDDVIVVSSGGNLVWSNSFPQTVAAWTQAVGYSGTATFTTVYQATGFTNFTISGDALIAGGAWTHAVNPYVNGESNRLCVTVGGNLLLTNASITADGLGYREGYGPGSVLGVFGAAHGGAAPDASPSAAVNTNVYGSIVAPTNLGSGSTSTYGVSGGGAIVLSVAGTTTVAAAGVISANGVNSFTRGGGAGGSIYLISGWLMGSGTLRANGGTGATGNYSGGGSGGRVAIVLTGPGSDFLSWTGLNSAFGGATAIAGAAGTVYRKTAAGMDSLIIDNNGSAANGQVSTLMPSAVNLNAFSSVVITNKGILGVRGDTTLDFNTFNPMVYGPALSAIALDNDFNVTYPADWTIAGYTLYVNMLTSNKPANVTIGTNGVLSHYRNNDVETYKVNLAISGNLTVLSNGLITADGLGYGAGYGPGKGLGALGAAYGGTAPDVTPSVAVNANTYGTIMAPTNMGSGSALVGGGGGVILLTVPGTTTVSAAGMISANGANSTQRGGASGGSLWLTTGWLTGGGLLRANGGNGASGNYSGGGGGGRVAIHLTGTGADFNLWTGRHTACGGTIWSAGAAGTVYRRAAEDQAGAGLVIVDNQNSATNYSFTSLPAFTNSTEIFKKTQWVLQNKGRIALFTNAVIGGLTLSTNAYLELAGFKLTTSLLTITNKAYRAGIYTAAQLGAGVTDLSGGSGWVEVTGVTRGTLIVVK